MKVLEIGQVRDWTGLMAVGDGEKWADLKPFEDLVGD